MPYSKLYRYPTLTLYCACSKMLNRGLNHGLFLSLFKHIPLCLCPIHWSISFIWIVLSTLYVYLWAREEIGKKIVGLLEELRAPQFPSEISWPLYRHIIHQDYFCSTSLSFKVTFQAKCVKCLHSATPWPNWRLFLVYSLDLSYVTFWLLAECKCAMPTYLYSIP